jgi:hypothetical protein
MVAAGNLAGVRAYCESDVLNLFVLYVRWAFVTGRINAASHNAALESLIGYLEGERLSRPHLGRFLDLWRASPRRVSMMLPVPPTEREDECKPMDHIRSEDMLR